ncbi:MAG: (Fe-S)-binding protein [Spirochaetota bacterium]|nr:(Fe-S)-binding protein [Spirochaetota bacterium]
MLIKEYSDLKIKTPDCIVGAPVWVAHFKLDNDVTQLFPYINEMIEDSIYYEKPHYIQFTLDGFRCALYPDNVAVAPFEDRNQAIGFIGRLIDFLNDIYMRMDFLKPNYKKYRHIPVLEIFKLLPQTNCKKCGYLSCMAFASAISKGETLIDRCIELNNKSDENVDRLLNLLSADNS